MRMSAKNQSLLWLEPGQSFPPMEYAWDTSTELPGLLCAGGDLRVATLIQAYSNCIFPWFSAGQPILWWSTDPRMVLTVDHFRLHPSFKKILRRFVRSPGCEIRIDSAFEAVIHNCAQSKRHGQHGTWIVPEMIDAYTQLHRTGRAHSVETWIDGKLSGGLYFVALGQAAFGESMFHIAPDASKIALAALVAMCRHFGVTHIDCQQNTQHLASLGASEMPRNEFAAHVRAAVNLAAPRWTFSPVYWNHLSTTLLAPT